jgi:hypothetical protein
MKSWTTLPAAVTEEKKTAVFNQLNAAEGELADEELDNVAGGDACVVTSDNPEVCALDTCSRYAGGGDGLCQSCAYVEKKRKNNRSTYRFFCTAGVQLHNLPKP